MPTIVLGAANRHEWRQRHPSLRSRHARRPTYRVRAGLSRHVGGRLRAGRAAGLDLCLHIVRQDHGAAIANAVARRLVAQPHRAGGQAQFIEAPLSAVPEDDGVARSMRWALEHLDQPISVASLARHAHLSTRSYLRHFARSTGTSPIRWLIHQRVQASLALLETTDTAVERIAGAVGFDMAGTYRHHFGQVMRTSPGAYRRAFRTGGAAPTA